MVKELNILMEKMFIEWKNDLRTVKDSFLYILKCIFDEYEGEWKDDKKTYKYIPPKIK